MRKEFIAKYDVKNNGFDIANPLTVGNGDFAFTCDITGLQTFYQDYKEIPLCTMSNLIWGQQKGKGELPYETYTKRSKESTIKYLTDVHAEFYDQYRDDSFKFDLFKLIFLFKNAPLRKEEITKINQRLDLYNGSIDSEFCYQGASIHVTTTIPQLHHNLQIHIETELKDLQIKLLFFEPASNLYGSTFYPHQDYIIEDNEIKIHTPFVAYSIFYKTDMMQENLVFRIKEKSSLILALTKDFDMDASMQDYFKQVRSIDTLDEELNRRMVLSLYLMKVNTLGIYPPAETGLSCNSWYGKFHLEMHLWHHLGLIRLGLYSYVIPSLKWYLNLYESSKARAKEQGYAGIRFPKMTDFRGKDTPSNIGCLLIWQMPHLLIFLDEIMKQDSTAINFFEFLPLIYGLIEFMEDFYYVKDGKYHLDSPLIPANENVPYFCDTPIFEECYTLHAFCIFKKWVLEYNLSYDLSKIEDILKNYVPLEINKDNCYEAFVGCSSTYTEFNYDHPMMIGMFSFFNSEIVDEEILNNTFYHILNCWDFDRTWGWDFPMLAMVAYRLGEKDLAIRLLKKEESKNTYLKNGHNPQYPKKDLPLYLPGNGAFLLAISMIFEEE